MDLGSSFGIATGYGLDGRVVGVRVPVGSTILTTPHRVESGSGEHPVSYPVRTGGCVRGQSGR
jgi:hypothetical protein